MWISEIDFGLKLFQDKYDWKSVQVWWADQTIYGFGDVNLLRNVSRTQRNCESYQIGNVVYCKTEVDSLPQCLAWGLRCDVTDDVKNLNRNFQRHARKPKSIRGWRYALHSYPGRKNRMNTLWAVVFLRTSVPSVKGKLRRPDHTMRSHDASGRCVYQSCVVLILREKSRLGYWLMHLCGGVSLDPQLWEHTKLGDAFGHC